MIPSRGHSRANNQPARETLSKKPCYHKDVTRIEPLRPEHLDNAFESIEAAFKDDPASQYIQAGRERSPAEQKMYKRFWKLHYKRLLNRKVVRTVNAGDSVIIATPPDEDSGRASPAKRTLDFLATIVWKSFLRINRHKEQSKRLMELEDNMTTIIESNLGDRAQYMVYIGLLATKPESQRHGYGTALLKMILFSADIQDRDVFLINGNASNNPFYESFGFTDVANFSLGEGNPKWDEPPVIVSLMVRAARDPSSIPTDESLRRDSR